MAVQDQAYMPMGYDKYIRGLADAVIAQNARSWQGAIL